MKLYLLSCHNILQYADAILPLLPEQRRAACARSGSKLTLGAGLQLASILDVHKDEDLIAGPQGKPFLASGKPEFSLSHSGEHVLLGVSDQPIGVDMEPRDRHVTEAVRKRVCLPQETGMDPLTVFTRKECAMKLTGLGFSLPLKEIDTTVPYKWEGRSYYFYNRPALIRWNSLRYRRRNNIVLASRIPPDTGRRPNRTLSENGPRLWLLWLTSAAGRAAIPPQEIQRSFFAL